MVLAAAPGVRRTDHSPPNSLRSHAPRFLSYNPYKLHVGDLVFFSSYDDSLMYFKVVSTVSLTASDACLCEKILTDD